VSGPARPCGPPDFDEFVAARSTRLLRTAFLLTHDRELAEDLLQTSLSKAWFAWDRMRSDPEPYVRRILVTTYASWWRRRWRGEQPTGDLPEAAPPHDGGHAERSATRHDLWTAMGRLPRRQRAVIVLRYFEDLTEAQTAAVLDCSVGTVKSQTARALVRLRVDPALGSDGRVHDVCDRPADEDRPGRATEGTNG
jgi:RNA polymerase sigma-70 factor (sigma-E family)